MFSSMLSLLGSLRGGSSFITNSLRFRSSASANLSRTPSAAGNRQVWTWSAWVKRGTLGEYALFGATSDASNRTFIRFNSSDQLDIRRVDAGTSTGNVTTAVFRDCSAWYHIVISVDFSQASATSRAIIYVNGVQQTLGTSNVASGSAIVNLNTAHRVGYNESSFYFDGYLTEVNFIDGQALTPASFGAIDSSTGVWSPRPYSGTYGTNGFRLRFNNTSSVAALGTDSSGNGNTWTVNNVSLTAGATYDSMLDVPVNYADGGNGRGNYCTLNPLDKTLAASISDGNLSALLNGINYFVKSTIAISSGKWYWEVTASATAEDMIGIAKSDVTTTGYFGSQSTSYGYYKTNGNKYNNASGSTYGASYASGDIIGVALDLDAGTLAYYKNGVSQGTAFTGLSGTFFTGVSTAGTGGTQIINFGQRPFTYTPPAGFRALNTNNLPTPSIVNGANFMAAKTYTGTGNVQSILNTVNSVSFQPDLVWIKSRTPGATNHALFDSVRGTTKYLSSDTTAAETTLAQSLTAFNADGFSLGTDTTLVNANANSYIAWQWKESAIAGLDVVSYTGTGANATIAHNLGVAPAMVIVKRSQTGATSNWQVRHTSIAAANSIQLNSPNQAAAAATVWNSTAPTSSVFSIGTSTDVNASGVAYVAYCFAEIAGFSKFGSYTGNGSADGPFVFCGFRPRYIMRKCSSAAGSDWIVMDTARATYNAMDGVLCADLSQAEVTGWGLDVTANGFKVRDANGSTNASGATYIYAAFAETPSKYALAR